MWTPSIKGDCRKVSVVTICCEVTDRIAKAVKWRVACALYNDSYSIYQSESIGRETGDGKPWSEISECKW